MRFPQADLDLGLPTRSWPVNGPLFITLSDLNPVELLGFGVWEQVGAGRVLVGFDSGQTEFDTLGGAGGVKDVTLTAAQSGLPQHTHTQNAHTHTQDAHTHTQNAHNHTQRHFPTATGASTGCTIDTSMSGTQTNSTLTTADATATNQNTTATNQNATAVNQDAGPTAAAEVHTNLQPYLVVRFWKRVA